MRRNAAVLSVVVLLAVASVSGVVAAQERGTSSDYGGEPDLEAYAPSPTVSPGDRGSFTLQIANDGRVTDGTPPAREAVTTARNVRVSVDAGDTPLSITSGTQSVGSVTENRPRSVPLALEVPADVEPGTYELEIDLRYSYTQRVHPTYGLTKEASRTVTRTVDVIVEDGPRFEVETVNADADVGGSGVAVVEVANVGTEVARDVTVTLESRSRQVTFEGSPTAAAAVGRLDPEESTTVTYSVDVGAEATRRSYPVDATVTFDDTDGFAGVDEDASLEVTPRAERSVGVRDVASTLRVGEEGTLEATVVNEGPGTLTNAVLTLQPPSRNAEVIEPEVAVGDLPAGESTDVAFDVEVATAARAGTRQFVLETAYEGNDGDTRSADPVRFRVDVGAERDAFAVDTGDAEVTAGGQGRVTVTVTNRLDEPVTDVSAKLFASSPLSADDDEAYVASLEPGESAAVPFRVSADGAAMAKDYPISVDVQYVDASGETRLSDSYRRPVSVVAGGGGLFGAVPPLRLLAASALLAAPLAPLALRRT